MNKIFKNTQILAKPEKLGFKLIMNTLKMGKMLKSKNFLIIFTKLWTEK